MAWATPIPSLGDVPRPTSSIKTSEFAVDRPEQALVTRLQRQFNRGTVVPRIMAHEAISLAKVLRLFSMSSSLERRVRSESCSLICGRPSC